MQSGSDGAEVPRWDLSPIYPSFDSPEWARDKNLLSSRSSALLEALDAPFPCDHSALEDTLLRVLGLIVAAGDLAENLGSWAYAVYSTNTRDERALREINAIDELSLPLGKALVLFRRRLAAQAAAVRSVAASAPRLAVHAFYLEEALEAASRELSPEMEDLANDLARSGADAWTRLFEALNSTATAVWDRSTGEKKTAISLRNLAFDRDRQVRAKAFHAEIEAWRAVEVPMAAALNGIKGTAGTLDSRRGWESALDKALFQARISRKTLDALIAAIEESLPLFRRYLKAKARLLGVPSCAFYDLFAPVGATGRAWSYGEARDYIVERFGSFDPGFGAFASRAFEKGWIDAEVRDGKVGGAYCTDFPLAGDSRVLCNFESSFNSVMTIAHELGHAWHHELIKELPRTASAYPMTLAETASIFAETVVFEGALDAASPAERLTLIEQNLQDACQVLVDILSRFRFEQSLFRRRAEAELSPGEFCSLMEDAQRSTYGDGLDSAQLHPYMWAVKCHYYNADLGFYNFPYAFGQLFGLSLFERSRREGEGFAAVYRELLRSTGSRSAVEVTRSAGFDIETTDFWRSAVSAIARRVDEFERLVKEA